MSSLVYVLNFSLQLYQAQQDPKKIKVMYLPLAEKMLNEFVKENGMTALAELLSLYHGLAYGQQTKMSNTNPRKSSRYACIYKSLIQ